jgi:hypothetical protein
VGIHTNPSNPTSKKVCGQCLSELAADRLAFDDDTHADNVKERLEAAQAAINPKRFKVEDYIMPGQKHIMIYDAVGVRMYRQDGKYVLNLDNFIRLNGKVFTNKLWEPRVEFDRLRDVRRYLVGLAEYVKNLIDNHRPPTTEEKIAAVLNSKTQWTSGETVKVDGTPFSLKPYQDTVRLHHQTIDLKSAPPVAMLGLNGWFVVSGSVRKALQLCEQKTRRKPAFSKHKILIIARAGGFCLEEQGGDRRKSEETFKTRGEASRAINGMRFAWETT